MVRVRLAATALLVVLLGALAGCNAFAGGGQSTATIETVTPVPVPNETTGPASGTATGVAFETPPGVGPRGSLDIERLRRAQRNHLLGRSYRLNITGRVLDGSRVQSYRYRAAVATGPVYRTALRVDGPVRVGYTDGDVTYSREYDRASGRWNVTTSPVVTENPRRYHADMLTNYMSEEVDRMDRVTRNGTTYVRLFFSGTAAPGDPRYSESATGYRVTAFVRPDGFIRTVVVTYEFRDDGRRREASLRFRLSAVGNTSVPEPAWVRDWRTNATTTARGTATLTSSTRDTPTASGTATRGATATD